MGRILILDSMEDFLEVCQPEDTMISIGMPNLEVAEDIFMTDLFIQQMMNPRQVLMLGNSSRDMQSQRLFLILTFRHPVALQAWSEFFALGMPEFNVHQRSNIKDLAKAVLNSKAGVEASILLEMVK